MRKFIAATRNKGKLKEISEILSGLPFEVISMQDAGIHHDIEENGNTFEENAMIKAESVFKITGEAVMADDSGLEVDFLGGAPGIYSARFAGEGATDHDKNMKLLGLLEDVPFEKRTARFVCAIAVILPDGKRFTVRGTCEGYIGVAEKGKNGFGYDPLFYLPSFDMAVAQLDPATKHEISHRGKALRMMLEELEKIIES